MQRNLLHSLLIAIPLSCVTLVAQNGTTLHASRDIDGVSSDGDSYDATISRDGRYVAFQSFATDLVGVDTNGTGDIFVRDTWTGETQLVSVSSTGVQANGVSYNAQISADGQWIAFESLADNLVANDNNLVRDVFVHNRVFGTTERVSLSAAGLESNNSSRCDGISEDGMQVVFFSHSSNLVAGAYNGWPQIYVRDRLANTTEHVSKSTAGASANPGTFSSLNATISADGRWVAFNSFAPNLVAGDTNGGHDVFLHDRVTGVTTRESVATGGAQGTFGGTTPSLSADGRYLMFDSYSPNLVAGDINGASDVFLRDTQLGTTTLVSIGTLGQLGNADSFCAFGGGISDDGRHLTFSSAATNLVASDGNAVDDVFVRDTLAATTGRVSIDSTGAEGDSFSYNGRISGDGRSVCFTSDATNLIAGDLNGFSDIFHHDRYVLEIEGCVASTNRLRMLSPAMAIGTTTTFQIAPTAFPTGFGLLYFGADGTDAMGCGINLPGFGEILLGLAPTPQLLSSPPTIGGQAFPAIALQANPAWIGLQVNLQAFHAWFAPGLVLEATNMLRVTITQ